MRVSGGGDEGRRGGAVDRGRHAGGAAKHSRGAQPQPRAVKHVIEERSGEIFS